jgi:hypothetical protein
MVNIMALSGLLSEAKKTGSCDLRRAFRTYATGQQCHLHFLKTGPGPSIATIIFSRY